MPKLLNQYVSIENTLYKITNIKISSPWYLLHLYNTNNKIENILTLSKEEYKALANEHSITLAGIPIYVLSNTELLNALYE